MVAEAEEEAGEEEEGGEEMTAVETHLEAAGTRIEQSTTADT